MDLKSGSLPEFLAKASEVLVEVLSLPDDINEVRSNAKEGYNEREESRKSEIPDDGNVEAGYDQEGNILQDIVTIMLLAISMPTSYSINTKASVLNSNEI